MQTRLVDFYRNVGFSHASLYNDVQTILGEVQALSLTDLDETAFVCKKSSELINDLRKQLDKAQQILEAVVCKRWSQLPEPVEISTDYILAQPKLKMQPTFPSERTDPEGYATLMRALDIPEHCWHNVRLHWPSLCDHITSLAAEGKPFPLGLKKIIPQYSLAFRQRKRIVENDKVEDENDNPF